MTWLATTAGRPKASRKTTMFRNRYSVRHGRGTARQAGYTLVEVLIATTLLLVVAVGVMPLFSRSIQSNLIGGRSTEMTAFAAEDIESVNQRIVDHEDWNLDVGTCADGSRCVRTPARFWRMTRDPETRHLGDGKWVTVQTTNWRKGSGQYVFAWQRDLTVRKYTYADVLPGNLDVATGTTLVPRGHPELFDVPLASDDGPSATSAHLIEVRVGIQLNESQVLDDENQRMNSGHFRAY